MLLGASGEVDPPGVPSLEEIQAAFAQFEILECIGRGGMGVVYKVRQPQLDRLLALKILLPGLEHDPGFAERFSREARALAKLGHPNIVAVHDFGETGGFFWLTMEYVDGVNLRQAMQAARFTAAQALALIPDLCAALQYAHDHGILHRDIKPENILLDTRGRVKVADFGIARIAGDERGEFTLTRTGSVLGSAAYIAPEQIERPHDVDHRADLYSLGVVFYEMLTGELPLGRFPAPSEKSASNPRLDEVVFRSLEKEREKRFQQAGDFGDHVFQAAHRPPRKPPGELVTPGTARFSISAIIAAMLTSLSIIVGVPVMLRIWTTLTFEMAESEVMMDFIPSLVARLPRLILGMILPGLSGTVLGIVSLFMTRSSRGAVRGIRIAGFAAFGWLVTGVFFVFVVYVIPMFGGNTPRHYVNGLFGVPECLALAATIGWCSEWLLAGWLGIPRTRKLLRVKAPWQIILPILVVLAVYVVMTLLIVVFGF